MVFEALVWELAMAKVKLRNLRNGFSLFDLVSLHQTVCLMHNLSNNFRMQPQRKQEKKQSHRINFQRKVCAMKRFFFPFHEERKKKVFSP